MTAPSVPPAPSDPLEILRCPACRGRLARPEPERFACVECAAGYPIFDGTPWLYRDVPGSRAQWAAKLQQLRTELLAEHAELVEAATQEDLLPSTRERLARHRDGLERLGRQVFGLLEVFAFSHSEAGGALPKDRIPSRQHVTSYLETVFRDWCWGDAELRQTLDRIESQLEPPRAGGAALVLGGGAGRLALELARRADWGAVVQLDLNPLLTRVASRVVRGETLELTEIPRFPVGLEHVAVDQSLALPGGPSDRDGALHFLLGDAFAPPFAEASFDLLVTPWFVDILPESFRQVAHRLARLLARGGRWVSFGPLSFEALEPEERFAPEEMREALEEAGFVVEHTGLESVDYLHSPHGMPRRGEQLFVFTATRREERPAPDDYAFYPEWMTDGSKPIPARPELEQLRGERTFDVEILKCIDGRASIEDIVVILSSRYRLEPDRCRNTVNRFFSKLIEGE